MIGKPLRINGSLRRRQTLMVMSPITKLDLLQRSFRQVQGFDYDETLSIIAMLKYVRTMLEVAAFHLRNLADGCQNKVSLAVSMRKGCMWYNQKVLSILRMLKGMQTPAILLWTGASILELEHTLWWGDQSIWVYTKFARNLYLQESEWEHYNISDKYMWMTYCWSEMM